MIPIWIVWGIWTGCWFIQLSYFRSRRVGGQRERAGETTVLGLVLLLAAFCVGVPFQENWTMVFWLGVLGVALFPALASGSRAPIQASAERAVGALSLLLHVPTVLILGGLWTVVRGSPLVLGMFLPFKTSEAYWSVVVFGGMISILVLISASVRFLRPEGASRLQAKSVPPQS